jgi:hypothetical protein
MAERRQYVKKRNHLSSHMKKIERKPGMSLLEQAKEVKIERKRYKKEHTEEELELVEAWLNDVIEMTKIQKVMNHRNSGQTYVFLVRGARVLHQRRMDTLYAQEKKKHESNS